MIRRAFGAGVLGAAIMSVLMAVSRGVGFPAKLELLLGSFFMRTTDARAWILGFVLHFFLGGCFALVYAVGFGREMRRAGLAMGISFGALHALVSGLALLSIPRAHPLVPDVLVAPGPFMANLGAMGVIAFISLHLVFGAIVGEICKPLSMNERWEPRRPMHR